MQHSRAGKRLASAIQYRTGAVHDQAHIAVFQTLGAAVGAEFFQFIEQAIGIEGGRHVAGGAMERAQPLPGLARRQRQGAAIVEAGQQRCLHDDGLQRNTADLFAHHGAQLGVIAQGPGHAVELSLLESFVYGAQIIEFSFGAATGTIAAFAARPIHFRGHAFAAVGKINDHVVNVVL